MPFRLTFPRTYRIVVGLLVAFSLFPVQAQPPRLTPEVAARIERVEQNLSRAVQVLGEPPYALEARMKRHKVPGLSVVVINGGRIEWAKGYGFANADSSVRVTETTLFQAASISKPVAALVALHWVERGKLALDADINGYLNGWQIPQNRFTQREKVTLHRLLTHTAGLTVHGFPGYGVGRPLPTVVQILSGEPPANTKAVFPDTLPGSLWRYSGGGYVVAQKALEDVLGKPFEQLAAETVLAKLGMTHSTYEQPLPARLEAQAATGFYVNGKPVGGKWRVYPEKAPAGLWTTPTDLAKYVIEVQQSLRGKSNRVISAAMTQRMLTPDRGWGLGPAVMQRGGDTLFFRHGGSNQGFRCELVANARTGQAVVVMTNSDNGGALAEELVRSIADVYGWGAFKPIRVAKETPAPEWLAAVKGTYQFQQRKIAVRLEGDHLMARTNWEGEYDLIPLPKQQFIVPENGTVLQAVQNAEGKVTGLTAQGVTFERKD